MRAPKILVFVASVCWVAVSAPGPSRAVAQPAATEPSELLDRVLAVVDEEPILKSDLERILGLELAKQEADETEADFHRRVLDQLIEQKLRFHEIDRYGFADVPLEEVEEQFEAMRTRMGGASRMEARLKSLDLESDDVRQILARQLMVLIYVEERLGPRVLIASNDIQTYYDETLVSELRSRGKAVPPIEEVRESIRALLREARLNEEIERWTEELRLAADIEDYLESEHAELPAEVIGRRD